MPHIRMPGVDALVTLATIKAITRKTGIIMITGIEDGKITQEAMKFRSC